MRFCGVFAAFFSPISWSQFFFCGTFYGIILRCRKNAAESHEVFHVRRFCGAYKSKNFENTKKPFFSAFHLLGYIMELKN